jgi:predicted transcriptional regulator
MRGVSVSGTSGRAAGALEREVLASLAAAGRPLTAGEVLADLGGGLAYTTVMTTLSRLHAKGVLSRQTAGRAYAYALATPLDALPASLTANRMRRLLDAEDDRASVLANFVAALDEDDERLLADLIDGRTRPEDGDGE